MKIRKLKFKEKILKGELKKLPREELEHLISVWLLRLYRKKKTTNRNKIDFKNNDRPKE